MEKEKDSRRAEREGVPNDESESEPEKMEKFSMSVSHQDGHHWVKEFFADADETIGELVRNKLSDRQVTEVSLQTQGLKPVDEETRG